MTLWEKLITDTQIGWKYYIPGLPVRIASFLISIQYFRRMASCFFASFVHEEDVCGQSSHYRSAVFCTSLVSCDKDVSQHLRSTKVYDKRTLTTRWDLFQPGLVCTVITSAPQIIAPINLCCPNLYTVALIMITVPSRFEVKQITKPSKCFLFLKKTNWI